MPPASLGSQLTSTPSISWTDFWTDNPLGRIDFGAAVADQLCAKTGIVKRTCVNCAASHQVIYYKRLSSVAGFSFYNNLVHTWSSVYFGANILGVDFQLFSSWNDLLANQNAWTFCNYDDFGIGGFRDCGPHGPVIFQWSSNANFYQWGPFTYSALDLPQNTEGTVQPRLAS
jgi:hypothetical protein